MKINRVFLSRSYTDQELRETLSAMRALIRQARSVAEPILKKWDKQLHR
ncbi:hypothetical protein [Acidithiobacillus thiooxidans]|nr:hypothetical protein [Acidithiobacillus thiooxidans]MDX5935684.1 hypothetical protein [Acidithiobacillus thiooxidans]